MRLVEQWQRIELGLPGGWADARLELMIGDEARRARAAALLGPLAPGLAGDRISFIVAHRGAGPGTEAVRRLLALLDEEGIEGRLELVTTHGAAVEPPARHRPTLGESWDAAVATLPDDWSDLQGQLELTSSDHLDRAALLMAPLNPSRYDGTPGFRFRVARQFGYGTSPQMTRRCLQRLDEEGIPGTVLVVHVLSDTKPAATQGPVWYVGGKVV